MPINTIFAGMAKVSDSRGGGSSYKKINPVPEIIYNEIIYSSLSGKKSMKEWWNSI